MLSIKIHFTDFSPGFIIENDIFYNWLKAKYHILIDKVNPDYLVYSCYGTDYLKYQNSVRIFYTAENILPDFNLCDYAIGFDYINFEDRYVRFPNFARYGAQFEQLTNPKSFDTDFFLQKTGFCNFIYSNAFADPVRDIFFNLLNKYKKVDSLGAHLKNTDISLENRYLSDWKTSKVQIQRQYKFSIAFENSSSIGYTTEKILHAFIANTIPIYWGNQEVAKDFNPKSFINCHDFTTMTDVVDRIIELENNDEKFLEVINQPPFINNQIPPYLNHDFILTFFDHIFQQPLCNAYRRPKYGKTPNYENRLRLNLQLESRFNIPNKILNRIIRFLE